jgi:hypothetical protein
VPQASFSRAATVRQLQEGFERDADGLAAMLERAVAYDGATLPSREPREHE